MKSFRLLLTAAVTLGLLVCGSFTPPKAGRTDLCPEIGKDEEDDGAVLDITSKVSSTPVLVFVEEGKDEDVRTFEVDIVVAMGHPTFLAGFS